MSEFTQPLRAYLIEPADREKSDWDLIYLFSRILAFCDVPLRFFVNYTVK